MDAFVLEWCTENTVTGRQTKAEGKSGKASDTIFKGDTPCSTNYSCTGWLVALVWLSPAWCSAVCCACGVPLKVVSVTAES